jgi:UDP-N-acetylbacillosamine N-acetyltransferase
MKSIYIYGASGHGLVVADIAKACGYKKVIYIDDGDNNYSTFDDIKNSKGNSIVFGIGDNTIRKKLFEKVKKYNFKIPVLIHPNAIISSEVDIGEGTVIMPQAVINAKSQIGRGVIINTSSVIEHENKIEDFVHISPSVTLAGNVKIKEQTHIGIGSCIIQGIKIGENSMIGAGSVVLKDIGNQKVAYGNPCKVIKEKSE